MASNHLFGGCGCERNQYVIAIPASSSAQAEVFFDNSAVSRRIQATPITAWLRIPLAWYSSATYAQYDDETHSSIKKTYHAPSHHSSIAPTRRQFCGYCGTSLTAWNETLHASGYGSNTSDLLDVTLGSLLNESLEKLETLGIVPDSDTDEESPQAMATDASGGRHGASLRSASAGIQQHDADVEPAKAPRSLHRMSDRGIPYFEELIEHSRLGYMKRQSGRNVSRDGLTGIQWEVVETVMGSAEPNLPG